jgi:hypothetical protein
MEGKSSMFTSRRGRALAIASLLTTTLTVSVLWHAHAAVLNWDDVDYVDAARLGFWANYFESGSLSAPAFIAMGRAKLAGVVVLPSGYDEDRDPLLLRHYHPPLGFYALLPVASASSDRVLRLGQLLGALLLVAAILVVYATVSPAVTAFGFVPVALLSVWATVHLFSGLSPHGWGALWCVLVPFLLSRWLRGEGRRTGSMLAAVLGASVATQMPFPALWFATLAVLLIWRRSAPEASRLTRRGLIAGTALAVGVAFVLWPGGFVKISLLKIPALQLYRLHLGQEFASVANRTRDNFHFLAPAFVAEIPAVVWLCVRARGESRRWGPFLVIGAVYAVTLLRFMLNPVYVLPAVCSLIPLVGYAIDRLPQLWHRGLAAAATAALPLVAVAQIGLAPIDAQERTDIDWLRTELAGRDTLADGAHIIKHYLGPQYQIDALHVDYGGTTLLLRRGTEYRSLEPSDTAGRTLLILKRRTGFFGSPAEQSLLAARCTNRDRPTLSTYRCP